MTEPIFDKHCATRQSSYWPAILSFIHRQCQSARLVCVFALLLSAYVADAAESFLYVNTTGSGGVEQYDRDGTVTSNFPGIQQVRGVAFDLFGNLFAVDDSNLLGHRILKFAPDGSMSVFADSGLFQPKGLAFDSAGYLYVGDAANDTVFRYASSGTRVAFAQISMSGPRGMAFDDAGYLYIANSRLNTIERFAPNGTHSTFASTGLNNPHGLAFDRSGFLYAANLNRDSIEKFAPDGSHTLFATYSSPVPIGAYGLAFDEEGILFVSDIFDGSILKFGPDGTLLGEFANSSAPAFITFGPQIPEPGTISLVLMSIAFAALARRVRVTPSPFCDFRKQS